MVDFLDEKGPPPRELERWWECQDFPGALPLAGGLDDQPAGLVARMRTAGQLYQLLPQYWRLPQSEFLKRYPRSEKFINRTLKLIAARTTRTA